MAKDKSIIEKFTDTMKGLADSASEALKSEEPPKADEAAAAYMPFAGEALVADSVMVPPFAAQPVRMKPRFAKKAAKRRAGATTRKTAAKKKAAAKTSARKAAKTAASVRSRKAAKKTAETSARKRSAKKAARVPAARRSRKTAKRRR